MNAPRDHIRRNRAAWQEFAARYAESGRNAWAAEDPYWGIWKLPESELLTDNGFVVERLLELGAPAGAETAYAWADAEWAQSWPSEEVWFLRYQP